MNISDEPATSNYRVVPSTLKLETERHGVTSQKIANVILTAMRISDLNLLPGKFSSLLLSAGLRPRFTQPISSLCNMRISRDCWVFGLRPSSNVLKGTTIPKAGLCAS
jgi:hypothetical protein